MRFSAFIVLCGLVLFSAPAFAATQWTGLGDGVDWFDPGNWDNGVPTNIEDTQIPGAGFSILLDGPGANSLGISVLASSALTVGATGNWNNNGGDFYLGNGPLAATFNVLSGGIAQNTNVAMIGIGAGVSAAANIQGYFSASNMFVGRDGATGTISVTNGGQIDNGFSIVGYGTGGDGQVTVDGAGSRFDNVNDFYIGVLGATGSLTVTNGGQITSATGSIGDSEGIGAVLMNGAGTSWIASGDMYVGTAGFGTFGTGTLDINNGAQMSSINGFIGDLAGGQGTVNVDGAGSLWANTGTLRIGGNGGGIGVMNVTNGGAATVDLDTYIGSAGSTGTLTISNADSSFTGLGAIYLGDGATAASGSVDIGEGNLTVAAGLYVFNGSFLMHHEGSLTGDLTIGGDGLGLATGDLTNADTFLDGSLNVGVNGTVTSGAGVILGGGTSHNLTMTNDGDATISGSVFDMNKMNLSGNGTTLVIDSGATGNFAGTGGGQTLTIESDASLHITGVGTDIHFATGAGAAENLRLTDGTMLIDDGAVVTLDNGYGFVGFNGGSATLTVDGAGSTLNIANGSLDMGVFNGTGALEITNGGSVYAAQGVTAGSYFGGAAQGNILVDGAGSVLEIGPSGYLYIAGGDDGDMTVSDGATVIANTGTTFTLISSYYSPGYTGTLTVDGAGTEMHLDELAVGNGAGSTAGASIQNGAVVTTSLVSVGGNSSTGTLDIDGAGSSLTISGSSTSSFFNLAMVYGGATTISNGGVLNIGAASADPAAAAGTLRTATLTGGAGGGLINFNHTSNNYSFDTAIDGSMDIDVMAGTTILTAANTYSGDTNVTGGRLIVDGSITSDTTIGASGLLGGTGTVGNVTNSGAVAPGELTTPGTLTIAGDYVGIAGSELRFNTELGLDGSPTDLLVFDGGAATGATSVVITNVGGVGGYSTTDGIRIIQSINGATTQAGMFTLSAPVQVGIYDYQLLQGGDDPSEDNDWFLRAMALSANVPVYAATPNLVMSYIHETLGTVHDRMDLSAELRAQRAQLAKNFEGGSRYSLGDLTAMEGAWVRAFGGQREFKSGDAVNSGYESDFGGLQVGKDLWRLERDNGGADHIGVYAAQGRTQADMTSTGGTMGKAKFDSTTAGAYWTRFGAKGAYASLSAQYTRIHEFQVTPTGGAGIDPGGNSYAASLEVGKKIKTKKDLVIEPQAQVIYQHLKISDDNDGINNISFDAINSVTARAGVRLSKAFETDNGISVQPWGRVNLLHTVEQDSTIVMGSDTFNTPFGGTNAELQLGLSLGRGGNDNKGWSVYMNAGYLAPVFSEPETKGWTVSLGAKWFW